MLYSKLQDMIALGYREKLMRKAEHKQGRTQWLGDFDWSEGFEEAHVPYPGKAFGQ